MKLDFNDLSALKIFLKRDKHKLLEGIVVEDLFMNDIVLPNKWNPWISKGWWAVEDSINHDSEYILFNVTTNPPTEADMYI